MIKITVIATARIHVTHDKFRSLMTNECALTDINLNFNRRLAIDFEVFLVNLISENPSANGRQRCWEGIWCQVIRQKVTRL